MGVGIELRGRVGLSMSAGVSRRNLDGEQEVAWLFCTTTADDKSCVQWRSQLGSV
jgi:hypothetical protein